MITKLNADLDSKQEKERFCEFINFVLWIKRWPRVLFAPSEGH